MYQMKLHKSHKSEKPSLLMAIRIENISPLVIVSSVLKTVRGKTTLSIIDLNLCNDITYSISHIMQNCHVIIGWFSNNVASI